VLPELVRFELIGEVARITLCDPTRLNAISYRMANELNLALDRCAGRARAVVLRGEGRAFCSGAAVTEMDAWPPDALRVILNPLVTRLRNFDLPLVTEMNGLAAGIACSIVLMGDMILAAEESYFLFAFGQVGLVPDGNSSYILPRLIGRARSAELMLLGQRLPARTALEWGMINRIVPAAQLEAEALTLAAELAAGPGSSSQTRKLLWHALEHDWLEHLEAESAAQDVAQRSRDHQEGVAAFKEKRAPHFTGQWP
jgi:2-(1,2-epoxy-1,2-dihydrophenyl)acetyl-CoA isomerase